MCPACLDPQVIQVTEDPVSHATLHQPLFRSASREKLFIIFSKVSEISYTMFHKSFDANYTAGISIHHILYTGNQGCVYTRFCTFIYSRGW